MYGYWEAVINLCEDYSSIVINTVYDANHGTGLKILTTKQMFQRLTIALAQVQAGNNS